VFLSQVIKIEIQLPGKLYLPHPGSVSHLVNAILSRVIPVSSTITSSLNNVLYSRSHVEVYHLCDQGPVYYHSAQVWFRADQQRLISSLLRSSAESDTAKAPLNRANLISNALFFRKPTHRYHPKVLPHRLNWAFLPVAE
jgi:hypothetical protein